MTADPLSPFLVIWAPILGLALAAGCVLLIWACLAAAAEDDRAREDLDGLFHSENACLETAQRNRQKLNGLWVVSRNETPAATRHVGDPPPVVVWRRDLASGRRPPVA